MELLENLYEKPPHFTIFRGRRYRISAEKTLILGMRKSGITSIIADFLLSLKPNSYLYINLKDIKVDVTSLKKLDEFIKKQSINHLVIENYTKDFPLPKVKNIILSSNDLSLHVNGFTPLHVKPLNFEEFIGFSQRHFNTEHLFNLFANSGRLPGSASLNGFENKLYMQECISLSLKDEISQKLFCLLAQKQAVPYSFFKAYNELKPLMKISKDKLYKQAFSLENEGLINYVQKFDFPKSPKKIYLTNFAYKNAVTYEKDFVKRFENMVFCELDEKEIYYTDDIHFYLPQKNQAILSLPFLPPELIIRRFHKLMPLLKSLHVTSLHVVTLGNEGSDKKEGIECEILPFWEWALVL